MMGLTLPFCNCYTIAMARLPALVRFISARFPAAAENVVANFARQIREAGLIRTEGPGLAAAHMDSRDTANLLMALGSTHVAKRAPRLLQYMRQSQAIDHGEAPFDRFGELSRALPVQPRDRTLGTCLEAIIDSFRVEVRHPRPSFRLLEVRLGQVRNFDAKAFIEFERTSGEICELHFQGSGVVGDSVDAVIQADDGAVQLVGCIMQHTIIPEVFLSDLACLLEGAD